MFLFSGAIKIFLSFKILLFKTIIPESGFFKPDKTFNSVDLPIPLMPLISPISFFFISKCKSSIKGIDPSNEKVKLFTCKLIFI